MKKKGDWSQLFHITSGSHKIHVLSISLFFGDIHPSKAVGYNTSILNILL